MSDLADPAAYATAFTATHPTTPISSGFSAWAVLAMSGALGEEAVARLGSITAGLPAGARTAFAAWTADVGDLRAWAEARSGRVATGPIPDQADADAWARAETDGIIDAFPLAATDPDTLALLASALVARTEWTRAFDVGDARWLGGDFARAVERCLVGDAALYDTRAAGRVGAVSRRGGDGLWVISVIADADRPPVDVHAAAWEIVRDGLAPVDPGRLEPGRFGWYAVTEVDGQPRPPRGHLPAWRAAVDLDLDDLPGLDQLRAALAPLLPPPLADRLNPTVKQVAAARFFRAGFEAAAVTAIDVRATAMAMPRRFHAVDVGFGHPYAALAHASVDGRPLPLFSAWITAPVEVDDEPTTE